MWLFVGFSDHEIKKSNFNYKFITLGLDGCMNKNIFSVSTWYDIYKEYGEQSFDAIVTDGGLHGVERIDRIIEIKRLLLKRDGFIYNYYSIIGKKVSDPLERDVVFWKVPKYEYTIKNHDDAYDRLNTSSWGDSLKARMRLII